MNRIKEILPKAKIPLFVIIVLFGAIFKLPNVKILGVVPTLYRVAIPLLTLYLLYLRFIKNKDLKISKMFLSFAGMMIFWILYGGISIFISKYSVMHIALQEIMNLILGLCVVYCIYDICNDINDIEIFLNTIKISCFILSFFAIFEIISGIHLPTSALENALPSTFTGHVNFPGLISKKVYGATGIFYGTNDFSVMLCIMCPAMFITFDNKKHIVSKIMALILVPFILGVNDANIAIFALLIGLIVLIVIDLAEWKKNCVYTVLVAVMTFGLSSLICKFIVFIKGLFRHLVLGNSTATHNASASAANKVATSSLTEVFIPIVASTYSET